MSDLDEHMRWLTVTMQAFAANRSKLTAAEAEYVEARIGERIFAIVDPAQARRIYRRDSGFGALH